MTIPRSPLLLALALLALSALARPLAAQLEVGQRLRVALVDDSRVSGTLTALSPETLVLETGDATRTLSRASVEGLEVSAGMRSHWKTGAAVGGVVLGVGTFVALNTGGSTNPCDADTNQDAMGMGPCLGIAAAGGLAGALLGGLIGSLVHSERWSVVPLGLSFAFTPTRR